MSDVLTMVSSTTSPDLAPLRARIDAIDEQIVALLKQRMEFVKEVGALKHASAPNACPIRPGREAQQLRRIVEQFQGGDFAPAAGAAIWRMIIMASLAVEGEMKISVYAAEHQRDLFWLAREYFGPFSAISRQPTPKRVIGDLLDGKAQVGVLPLLEDAEQNGVSTRWWTDIATGGKEPLRVFAHVPFLCPARATREVPYGLAIGRVEPEPTGNDLSLFALQCDETASQHRLQTAFGQAKLEARWIEVFSPMPQVRWHVVELKGFVRPTDEAFQQFCSSMGAAVINSFFLGAYAQPVVL